ncbi:related to conserved hypothetical Ustilaginaceae-specific protein [Ustilago sp. UG-2017a]|nr:related to conserved hypothetical Ustilaginaceae-specific protein [Ustilago sp. UG-2017a]
MAPSFALFSMLSFTLIALTSLQTFPAVLSAKMPYWDGIGPQVTQDLDRSPSAQPLTQVIPPWLEHKCTVTPLQIDAEEYKARCLPGKGPCFTHKGDGSLKTTNIEPWLEPLDMTQEILLMDDTARDFTVRDPSTPFEITYLAYANAKIRYSNFNPETRCYDILIKAGEHGGGNISVGESPADMSLFSRSSFSRSSSEHSHPFCAEHLYITIY